MPKIETHKVLPIGTETHVSLHGDYQALKYPPNENAVNLRHFRRNDLKISLAEAANRLGVPLMEYCDLENGSRVVEDWQELHSLMKVKQP